MQVRAHNGVRASVGQMGGEGGGELGARARDWVCLLMCVCACLDMDG